MFEGQRSTLLAYLRRLAGSAATDRSDAELLERFVQEREESAFEALLHRHGPLVWSVCRRVLTEEHAAEDAFQATFLVLVRKAQSVSKKASIRSWLHGVALRVSLRARQQEQLHHRRERETPIRSSGEATWQDVRPILDEEIQRLPEKYRLPVILCYLEGQTNDDAARLLNCPRGTIATRLTRARERLRLRLLRRGVTLSTGSLAAILADNAVSATLPSLLLAQTAKSALLGAASGSIIKLTEGVLHAMFLSKAKAVTAFVLTFVAMCGAGVGAYYLRAQAPLRQVPPPNPAATPQLPVVVTNEYDPPKEWKALLKRLEEVTPDKNSAGMSKESFQKLLQARRDMAEKGFKIRYELYRSGANEPGMVTPVTLHMLVDASKRLLKAELELSKSKAERLKALEKQAKFMKENAKITAAMYRVGRVSSAALAQALYEQLDSEIELEREKAR